MTHAELKQALAVFGLSERATYRQIKQRHRELVRAHHPDATQAVDDETIREINRSYALLRTYCEEYRFDFSYEEFLEQNPEERLKSQFDTDPVWGGKSTS